MRFAKFVVIALASTVAAASVQAATLSTAKQQSQSVLELIKKKKDKAGHCGEYKYFDKKKKKCTDSRKKK